MIKPKLSDKKRANLLQEHAFKQFHAPLFFYAKKFVEKEEVAKDLVQDAFVLTNMNSDKGKSMLIQVSGCKAKKIRAFRTTEDENEKYKDIGVFELQNEELFYVAPKGSVTTFFAEE